MADIEHRQLVPQSMEFEFTMREVDMTGTVIRTVSISLDAPDSITHDEITEAYQNFLMACGYVLNAGEIRYVRYEE